MVRAVEVAARFGFRPDVDFLFATPGETAEDRRASLELAQRLVRLGARIHNHSFLPLPGTPLRDREPEALKPEETDTMLIMRQRHALLPMAQLIAAERLVGARRRQRGVGG